MTKTKKIIIGVIILAVAVCAVFVTLFEIGFFEKSNYKFLNYDKYVKVGKYKGLKYTAKKVSVTQKEIDQEITSRRTSAQTQKSVKSGTLAKGDVANISYVGKIDGKKFEGGSASDYDLTLGSNSMIKGFESGLIGHKVGDKVKLNLTFPKDYGTKKLRNKKAVFEVTINAKKVTVTPQYDTAFIKQNTGNKYSTKEDYEKYIKEYLTKQKEATALSEVKSDLWSQVVTASKSTGKYPKKQLAYEKEKFTNQYKNYAKNYNMSFKTFLKAQGMTEKTFNKKANEYAKTVVKQKCVMYSIAKKEGIKVTDKQYKAYLKKMLKNAGYTESSFQSQYGMTIEKYGEENDFKTAYMLSKVVDNIYSSAKKTK